ncbi:phytanoyl-CoA dioxygenase family protein [Stackebrandtia albiflava]|uniref:phytanoyl-CoA dioxygenase family protein n=1 Tax=Stackebrandtia albiflava TaxID=406432 RepID=UPI0011BFE116
MDVDGFRENGYLVLRDVVPDHVTDPLIAVLGRRVAEVAAERHAAGRIPGTFADLPFDRRIAEVYGDEAPPVREWRRRLRCEAYHRIVTSPELLSPLRRLLGDEITYQGNSHLRPYVSRHLDRLPWHQDAQFYGPGVEGMLWNLVQVWLPLTDAPVDGGCMAVVPGSHRWGLVDSDASGRPVGPDDDPERVYRAAADRARFSPAVLLPMRRGDLLVFTNLLVHTGTENRSGRVRWSVDMRFESTADARPRTDAERLGYRVTRARMVSRDAVPLRVASRYGPEDWPSWRSRLATGCFSESPSPAVS